MRVFRAVVWLILLSASVFAADLKIRVLDPHSNPVPGAQVSVFPAEDSAPIGVLTTSSEGSVSLNGLTDGRYRLQVLAPGFAPRTGTVSVPQPSPLTVNLAIAGASEIVVVTATRTPVPERESGASVSTLERGQLQVMQSVAASDAIRFLPGAVVNTVGQRGGQSSLFVRGGDSRYNKVIVDGVPVNDPGGIFDFGTVPLGGADRLEFLRGAQSTLYGSDAMTSVVQIFTHIGSSESPELRFGADGGNLSTAHGFLSLAGARDRFDYNLFGDQFNTQGSGINDNYSNSLQGANLGARLGDRSTLRIRTRHSNSRSGVQGEWKFDGLPSLPPDADARARQNNLLASAELTVVSSAHWQHRVTAFEYNHRTLNEDIVPDRGCDLTIFDFTDCYFRDLAHINRAGLNYQGDYIPRDWAQTTLGYEFEDENGFFNTQFTSTDVNNDPIIAAQFTHGLRLNHALFVQQRVSRGRLSVVAGLRYAHNDSFGDRAVPRVALTFLALRGGQRLSGTRLRFSYAQGIKAPRFEESFGISGVFPSDPNPNLKPEENRAFEAGFEQSLFDGKYALSAVYFNNHFRNQIEFTTNPQDFNGQYVNVNRSLAHGVEIEFKGRLVSRVSLDSAYNYTSTQILEAPLCTPQNFCDPLLAAGEPLIRRPRHSGSLLLYYLGSRWGGNLGGSFVGRRADSDFLGLGINHAAGYARIDLGGWYAINSHVTSYVNVENALNKQYEEVVGYPALGINFRAGLRFRFGGN
ncbi:MAG: TonB-dependent receptor [Terriglobales bacterium]